MSEKAKHSAIGLVNDAALRQHIAALLPDYEVHWGLDYHQAINQVADLRPAFLLVDVDDHSSRWADIIIALQSSPATRRLPLVGIATDPSTAPAGIDDLLAWATLPEHLPGWVAQQARVWDEAYYAQLAATCDDDLPEAVQEGIRLFNAHEFWEAHEVLESAWIAVRPAPIGEVYRSILQVGVAYYQIQRGNYRGALKMFLRVVQWLDPLPDECQGIDLAQFKRDAAAARAHLEALGGARIGEFDQSLFKPVPFV